MINMPPGNFEKKIINHDFKHSKSRVIIRRHVGLGAQRVSISLVKKLPWAGVSMAPRGEVGTLLSQELDVMKENVTS